MKRKPKAATGASNVQRLTRGAIDADAWQTGSGGSGFICDLADSTAWHPREACNGRAAGSACDQAHRREELLQLSLEREAPLVVRRDRAGLLAGTARYPECS